MSQGQESFRTPDGSRSNHSLMTHAQANLTAMEWAGQTKTIDRQSAAVASNPTSSKLDNNGIGWQIETVY